MPDPILLKNMEVIRKRLPEVADYLEKTPADADICPEETGAVFGVSDVAGKKVLWASKEDRVLRLDSLYDSAHMLNLWFDGLGKDWDLNNKLYMFGLGNGMYARKFLESARSDCRMIIHEPSYKLMKTVIENFDLSDVFADERVELVFWPLYDSETFISYYQDMMEYTDVFSYKTAVYLNYPSLYPSQAQEYTEGLHRVADFIGANQKVTDRFGAYYTRNALSNLRFLRDSMDIEEIAGKMPEDIPAIIVAAGPSLDKNIKELANAKGRCIIISTDTALKPLSLAGIVPDIAMIMDGKKDERYLSEEDSRKIPLVCTPRSGTEFLHLHTGLKFFTDDFCDHINEFMKMCDRKLLNLETGGSVANSCFSLARLFHCKRIILVGQDLAYTGDKTHSHVTVRGSVKTAVEDLEHVIMDIDIDGNPVRSSQEFRYYREWFEQQIADNSDLTVIDATEGGVRIAGTQLMTAKEAIEGYCTDQFDFASIISDAKPLFDEKTRRRFDEYVKAVPGQMGDLRRLIRAALADYSSMRRLIRNDNYHSSRMKQLYDNCQKQTQRIENSPVIEYVHNQLQGKSSELLDNVNKLEKDEKQDLLSVCDMGERYLQNMDDAITEIEPLLDTIRNEFGS